MSNDTAPSAPMTPAWETKPRRPDMEIITKPALPFCDAATALKGLFGSHAKIVIGTKMEARNEDGDTIALETDDNSNFQNCADYNGRPYPIFVRVHESTAEEVAAWVGTVREQGIEAYSTAQKVVHVNGEVDRNSTFIPQTPEFPAVKIYFDQERMSEQVATLEGMAQLCESPDEERPREAEPHTLAIVAAESASHDGFAAAAQSTSIEV